MSRHDRRRAAKTLGGDVPPMLPPGRKAKISLHTAPESMTTAHLALLMVTLTEAYRLSKTLPGITFPIHVVVRQGDVNACGEIEPAGDGDSNDRLVHATPCTHGSN